MSVLRDQLGYATGLMGKWHLFGDAAKDYAGMQALAREQVRRTHRIQSQVTPANVLFCHSLNETRQQRIRTAKVHPNDVRCSGASVAVHGGTCAPTPSSCTETRGVRARIRASVTRSRSTLETLTRREAPSCRTWSGCVPPQLIHCGTYAAYVAPFSPTEPAYASACDCGVGRSASATRRSSSTNRRQY